MQVLIDWFSHSGISRTAANHSAMQLWYQIAMLYLYILQHPALLDLVVPFNLGILGLNCMCSSYKTYVDDYAAGLPSLQFYMKINRHLKFLSHFKGKNWNLFSAFLFLPCPPPTHLLFFFFFSPLRNGKKELLVIIRSSQNPVKRQFWLIAIWIKMRQALYLYDKYRCDIKWY